MTSIAKGMRSERKSKRRATREFGTPRCERSGTKERRKDIEVIRMRSVKKFKRGR